ncbi:hypothetical protein CVT26_006166, partial [Gymnopilus dilepis]
MQKHVKGDILIPYAHSYVTTTTAEDTFKFFRYTNSFEFPDDAATAFRYILVRMPMSELGKYLSVRELRSLASLHGIPCGARVSRDNVCNLLEEHEGCDVCTSHFAVFEQVDDVGCDSEEVDTPEVAKASSDRHRASAFTYMDALRYIPSSVAFDKEPPTSIEFFGYLQPGTSMACDNILETEIPLPELIPFLNKESLNIVAASHGIMTNRRTRAGDLKASLLAHECQTCPSYVTTWKLTWTVADPVPSFPPSPLDIRRTHQLALAWANAFQPENILETGCTVCGLLHLCKDMREFDSTAYNMDILHSPFSRQERRTISDPIKPLDGPLLDDACNLICDPCHQSLKAEKLPLFALANGFWLGKVPDVLCDLTFAEKLLIARVRHNRCVVRVASGRVKMMANVIMFSNPTPVLYNVLPPPKDELDHVLAFVYTGSSMPTEDEKTRTPLLVRRNKVAHALDWLKLNHCDYHDLEISQENLMEYPENGIPFIMQYHASSGETNRDPLTMSLYDQGEEEGTSDGPCPFTVHGLTGAEYSTMSTKTMKALALRHLQSGGKVLGIGHEGVTESMYDNPQAYPKMFPWLFPYGYGGINQRHLKGKVSSAVHKRNALMYHDKRFQTDVHFPIVAFNHEQMKSSVTGSFLTAKRADFANIADRLSRLSPDTLVDISGRMLAGEVVKPATESEKFCFSLLNDIDHIGGHVDGSMSTKKQRRNELWSLMAFKGAPLWFVTFSPADVKHPLCIYYAGKRLDFQPNVPLSAEERKKLISENPVAAARFFHFMVQAFICHILGMGDGGDGLFGKTDAYYGMVEQQGRLTLHLHILLWIAGSPSPQEIRDRLMSRDQAFQDALINYLESVHTGDFLTGTKDDVKERVEGTQDGVDATLQMPVLPPQTCMHEDTFVDGCDSCHRINAWYEGFKKEVDELLLRSNLHTCRASAKETGVTNGPKGCLSKDGLCAARFPRDFFAYTIIDPQDGHIDMKKTELMMNTVAPLITYAMRSNTDCTCLLSGTAIKSVIIYVTDYVVKQTLKSHQIFSTAYDVLNRNETVPDADENALNSSRRTLLKIVNALSTKLEIGSPMASMYLLKNPDHYTSHSFVPFYWKSYVTLVRRDVNGENIPHSELSSPFDEDGEPENLQIGQNDRRYYEKSKVHDYIFRPVAFE